MLHLTAMSIIVSFFLLRCLHISHYACYCHLALNEKVINSCHYHCKLGYNYELCNYNHERCQNQTIMATNQMGHIWIFLNKKYKCGLLSTYNIWTFFFHKSSYIGR